jgi:hypothetical protein
VAALSASSSRALSAPRPARDGSADDARGLDVDSLGPSCGARRVADADACEGRGRGDVPARPLADDA